MKCFASDNSAGVHPQIMQAMSLVNHEHTLAYGDDEYTREAEKCLQSEFGQDTKPYFVFTGTGANMLALQALVRPFHSVLAAASGHICVDECGAPARFLSCAVKEIQTTDGKLTPDLIRPLLHGFGDQHHSQPKAIYLSQPTELGTVYRPEELQAICDLAHAHEMYVHMDGARLANACAFLNRSMRELSRDCGIDILSLGGTKNGMMMGEAVVAFRSEFEPFLRFYRKQSAQLYSKMRFQSAQFVAYMEDELWLRNARCANERAQQLAEGLGRLPRIRMTQPVESNAVFLTMDRRLIEIMQQSYFFYVWNETKNEIRLVCSWDTSEADVSGFIACLKGLLDRDIFK
jgi:threonine aldolase